MIKSYFKIILRGLARHKTFSIINLSGLSIGLTCAILIAMYVVDEFSFDRYHSKADRIYQLATTATFQGQTQKWIGVPNLAGPTFQKEIPEVEKAVRLLPNNFSGKAFVSSDQVKSTENRLVFADAEIFSIISLPFVKGEPSNALARPHTVVVSEASAIKYFGTTDIIGKSLRIDRDTMDFEITGVMANAPSNTRFQYPVIATFNGSWFDQPGNQSWGNASFETYLLLHENVDAEVVRQKIAESLDRNIAKDNRWFTLDLHPLKEIHLQYADVQEINGAIKGDLGQLRILIGLGLIIIVIAAVNYMNLSTAQSQRRFKEIGINKTLGATGPQLARKFYMETAFFVFAALVISVMLVILTLPVFNSITGKQFYASALFSGWFVVAFGIAGIVLTLLAGIYPAQYLSSFSPREVLKGSGAGLGGNSSLRKGLVIVQFSISIILIISTLILFQQLRFIREKKLGYRPEQVVAIGTTGAENREQVNSLKSVLENLASVSAVARSQAYPGEGGSGRTLPALDGQGAGKNLTTVRATSEVLNVLGIELLAGRTLPEKSAGDTTVQLVLNKTAVNFLGLTPDEAINRKIQVQGFEYGAEIVGVVDDFHFSSLRQPIGAYCFHNAKTEGYSVLLVKLVTSNLTETLAQIETEFKKIIPSAFVYTFLDQQLQTLYQSEQQLATVIFVFAALAIFIACLGLYALAAYTTEQRTKEIGIRKVMGATVTQLSAMLSRDFMKLVLISFVIAAPIGYFAMDQWLGGFAYRVDISLVILLTTGLAAVGIAWFTVGFESLKAARSNPIRSLRSE
jgi:putative ABC transport system permease protein